MCEDVEKLDVHGSELRKLRDLKPTTTDKPLIVDASETPLKSFACNSEIGDRIRVLNVRSCCVGSFVGISYLKNLQELDAGNNQLTSVSSDRDDSSSPTLHRLDLSRNLLSTHNHLSFVGFPALTYLDLSNNCLEQLDFISSLSSQLQVLNISNNKIGNLCEFYYLHSLVNLEEVDLGGNPVAECLSDHKLLVLVKAIVLGKLETVNGICISNESELTAEALHCQGIRRFKPENSTHESLVAFVNTTIHSINNKQLEMVNSQRRSSSVRRSVGCFSARARAESEVTPHRRPATTPTIGRQHDLSLVFKTPATSVVKKSRTEEVESASKVCNSEILIKELQSKMNDLFSLYEEQKAEITTLKAENTELRGLVEKQALQLNHFENQLSIVPTNIKAMRNVKNYELDLGDENQVYTVKAPNRRVVIDNPVDGQKIRLRAIQRNGIRSASQEFTIRLPCDSNKENLN